LLALEHQHTISQEAALCLKVSFCCNCHIGFSVGEGKKKVPLNLLYPQVYFISSACLPVPASIFLSLCWLCFF